MCFRAGAFQFIDSITDDTLPLPYQIQIISRDGGIICWRYPQPRALHYIQIFPVPFHVSHDEYNLICKVSILFFFLYFEIKIFNCEFMFKISISGFEGILFVLYMNTGNFAIFDPNPTFPSCEYDSKAP